MGYYDETLQIEVCAEYAASIQAAFFRYANEKKLNFDDKESPVIKAKNETGVLVQRLYRASGEQIQEIKEQLDRLKAYLFEVNPSAII